MVEQREQESALLAALRVLPPRRRKHFLTFKGTVYDRSSSHPDAAQRLRLLPLHDPEEGVVVVGRCMPPEKDPKCAEYRRAFDTYEFEDLANTTFGLVPAGRSPATYRLAEVMAAGAIPVVVASDYVLPFTGTVDWSGKCGPAPPVCSHCITSHLIARPRSGSNSVPVRRGRRNSGVSPHP